ncbi:MAG TPA: amidase [bacterium]|nr:amidase [bacterium]
MNAEDLCYSPISDLAARVASHEVTALEVARTYLSRIDQINPAVNAYMLIMAEQAEEDARRVDDGIAKGKAPGLLGGVPLGIKDLIDVAGVPTASGAHRRFHYTTERDAPLISRLRRAGAVILGKTNLHEFAYGVTNINPHTGSVRNPWDKSRIPGGSSGGSAAAVSAGLCAGALGSDTGGSIRIPSALCGTVGLKPTYDRIPRTGVVALAWTLDHLGPITRTTRDAALLLRVMEGADPGDPASATSVSPLLDQASENSLKGVRIGVPRTFFWERSDPEVHASASAALRALADRGATVLDVDLPHAEDAGRAVAIILSVEATAYHERRLRTSLGVYGDDLQTRLLRGFFIPATDYVLAQRARAFITAEFLSVFHEVDVLVTPTTTVPARSIEEDPNAGAAVSLAMSTELTRFTNPFNLTGMPALSVPCGFTRDGLPVGFQIVGKPFDEAAVLRVGHVYEQATGWHNRRPNFGHKS